MLLMFQALYYNLSCCRHTIAANNNETFKMVKFNFLRSDLSVGGVMRPVMSRLEGAAMLSTGIKPSLEMASDGTRNPATSAWRLTIYNDK